MATVFTPQHSPLDQVFARDTTYTIPPYQRPYSWQALGKSDKDSQVIQLWDDLWSFFRADPKGSKEYFLGSMVLTEDPSKIRKFEVIDGQQRLTTLLLLFAAMRCFLSQAGDQSSSSALSAWTDRGRSTLSDTIYNTVGLGLTPELKLKIVRSIKPDFGSILQSAIDCKPDQEVVGLERKHREIALRYFKNRDYFMERLREHFLPGGTLRDAEANEFDQFFRFLQARVAIVLIKTTNFETAYGIFEILNNRGLPLSNLDLLRNFVISELMSAGIDKPEALWERLETDSTLTEDFVNRWTESIHAAQPKTSAFTDIKEFYKKYADAPGRPRAVVFYDDAKQNLEWYTLLSEESADDWKDPPLLHAVQLIRWLDNQRYSMDLMLALLRFHKYQGGANDAALHFLKTYLRYALYIQLVPASGRFNSSRVYDAIRHLNKARPDQAQACFELDDAKKQALVDSIAGPIKDNDMARRLLAAYFWHQEEAQPEDVVAQRLDYEKATLEHIIPQDPAKETNWLIDFSDEFRAQYTYRLGNMTLLTPSRNSANRNFDFSKKKEVYRKAKFSLTVKLAEQAQITEDYIRQRHQELVADLCRYFELL